MKPAVLISMPAFSLLIALAIPARLGAQEQSMPQQQSPRPRYTVTDLGPAGARLAKPPS